MKRISRKLQAFFTALTGTVLLTAVTVFADGQTLGERLSVAGRNTLLGLITVFIILLLLSLIISLFRFIAPKKKTVKKETTEFVLPSAPKESAEDEELVAVIMAAIAASEGDSYIPGQYRLKSIKRIKSTRRWNRARREI